MNELLVATGLIAGVAGAHVIGFWLGSLRRTATDLIDSGGRQMAAIRK